MATLDITKIGNTLSTGSPLQVASQPTAVKTTTPQTVNPTPVQSLPLVNPNVNYFSNNFQPALSTTMPTQTPTQSSPSLSVDPNAQLTQKYQNSFQQAQSTGQKPPTTTGEGSSMVNKYTGGATPTPVINPVDTMLAQDKGYQDLLKMYSDFTSAEKQKETAVQEYQRLEKESGLEKINTDLINMRNVIEGTEQDIRNEISATGGFATESQVQALAGARNKGLIRNYNNLLEMQKNIQGRLDTMVGLSQQDRQYAQQQFENQFNFQKQMIEYRDKFVNNAKESYNSIIKQVGYAGLAKALENNPNELALVERTLGLAPGGLQQLATYTPPQSEADKLDIQYKKAQIANIYSEIAKRNSDNTVMVDTSGKVILKPEEALKINKELVSNDAYKAIQKSKDSLQFLKNFQETFEKTGATSAVFSPRKNAELSAKYNAAILNLKEFFNLGVLNGPDEAILRSVLPDPTNRSAALTVGSLGIYNPAKATEAGLTAMKDMIEKSLDDRFQSLSAQYGDFSSQSLGSLDDLGRIYIEQKLALHPEGFDITVNGTMGHVNSDGTVTLK